MQSKNDTFKRSVSEREGVERDKTGQARKFTSSEREAGRLRSKARLV